jgi:uncharacterized protein YdhG (YjbR/CyaY superfamily)
VTRGSPIDDYLSGAEEEQRAALEVVRRTVAEVVPEATEGISYGMPAFRYRGRPLVGFAAFKKHCSLFPWVTPCWISSETRSQLTEQRKERCSSRLTDRSRVASLRR